MNKEDIIRMAREAGGTEMEPYDYGARPDRFIMRHEVLERFAALVATFVADRMIRNGYRKCAEGQRTTQFCGQLESAVAGAYAAGAAAEREACAQIADAEASIEGIAQRIAAAIRARGNT